MAILTNARFSPSPDVPLYQQVYAQLRSAILSGELKGDQGCPPLARWRRNSAFRAIRFSMHTDN